MDGAERTESTGRWVGRVAVRYLAWLIVGWVAYVVYISHTPYAAIRIRLVGEGLVMYLGVPTVGLLALLAPRLRAKWNRPLATVWICAPALLIRGGFWVFLILALFQIGFGAVLLPRPRPLR